MNREIGMVLAQQPGPFGADDLFGQVRKFAQTGGVALKSLGVEAKLRKEVAIVGHCGAGPGHYLRQRQAGPAPALDVGRRAEVALSRASLARTSRPASRSTAG